MRRPAVGVRACIQSFARVRASAFAAAHGGRHRRLEHLEHARRRRLSFGAGVELGAGAAQRDEDLRRYQEDRHGRLQVELTPEQAEPEHHGDEPDPEPGEHVHGERGQEGDPQRAHGGGPHAFGRRLDLPAPLRLAAEGAQGGQTLDELQDAPGQRAEPAPLPLRALGRLPAEGDHRHGHRQDEGDDDHERQPVLGAHPDQQDERDDGGRGGLGEVARVIGVERAQPPGGRERQLARALTAQPAGPQRQGVLQQLAPQRGHDAVGGAQAPRGRRRRASAARARMASPTTTMAGVTAPSDAWCSSERSTTEASATACTTTATALSDGEGHCGRRDPPEPGHPGREVRVDQAGPAPRGVCAHRLNVVSFTETVRPMRPSVTARRAVAASSQVAAVRTPSGRSATMAVRTGSRPDSPP